MAFYEAQDQADETGSDERDGDELFETWRRILNAREELARGEKKPLPYRKWQARGREATFTLDPIQLWDKLVELLKRFH